MNENSEFSTPKVSDPAIEAASATIQKACLYFSILFHSRTGAVPFHFQVLSASIHMQANSGIDLTRKQSQRRYR